MKQNVKISILCEDQARMGFKDKIFLAQHGFSVFIEAQKKIIFDTGSTDVFIHNANLLGINLDTADLIVLSHGHWDHANGLKALQKKGIRKMRLLLHPGAFVDRRKSTGEYNGISLTQEEVTERFDLILSREPYQIADEIYFLGEIPRRNDFEAQKTTFFYMNGREKLQDFVMDDTALAIRSKKGLVIVTGCSHTGICNIVEYAKEVTKQDKVHMVMGGFHLLGDQVQLKETIDYFLKNRVDHLYPMHCINLPSLSKFYEIFKIEKLCAGDTIEFDVQ